VVAFARGIVAHAEQPWPLHVLRIHDPLLHARPVLYVDLSPDGEAVVLEEHGALQVLHADESLTAPWCLWGKGANSRDAVRRRPAHQRALVVHQSELEVGVDDGPSGGGGGVTQAEVQRDEAGVLLFCAVEIEMESPGVASCLERRGLYAAAVLAAVRRLEPRVVLTLSMICGVRCRPP